MRAVSVLVAALEVAEARVLLARFGRYAPGSDEPAVRAALSTVIERDRDAFLLELRHETTTLDRLARGLLPEARPGRSEALRAVARALGTRVPAVEYALPEEGVEALLERALKARGRRVPVAGARRHKGRVGDGVERLLLGSKAGGGSVADHPAAEIKSVPVRGDQVIERVKLGVVSATSNPLHKCARVLFVFVEERGADHFVRGHALKEFEDGAFTSMWRAGFLVETAAGSPRHRARGLYLTPGWFRHEGLWPLSR